jgi:hypothetical protein
VEGDLSIEVSVRGLRDIDAAAQAIVNQVKRALFLVDGDPGLFGADIRVRCAMRSPVEMIDIGLSSPGREWSARGR